MKTFLSLSSFLKNTRIIPCILAFKKKIINEFFIIRLLDSKNRFSGFLLKKSYSFIKLKQAGDYIL
jgi:hypothetical protein